MTPTGKQTVEELEQLLEQHGARMLVHHLWFWAGRGRHGRIEISLRVDDKKHVKASFDYSRNTMQWCFRFDPLVRVRTGSPRHRALMRALAWVRSQLAAA